MAQYVENVLKFDSVSRRKSGSERLRMFFDAAPGVESKKKVDEVDCDEKKSWKEEMKDRVGGWWW